MKIMVIVVIKVKEAFFIIMLAIMDEFEVIKCEDSMVPY